MNLLINWLIYSVAILIGANILPGIHVANFTAALIAAIVLGILNALLKPILIILTLPVNILTLGLFTLVINAVLILLAAQFVDGFTVDGFWWALIFSIILSLISGILFSIAGEK